MLALLAEGAAHAGTWKDAPPPSFRRLIGVEARTRVARLARIALESDAIVVNADARTLDLEPCDTVLLFDVLHMMMAHEQDAFLARVATRLRSGRDDPHS